MLAILFDTPHSHKVSLCNHAKLNSGVLGSPLCNGGVLWTRGLSILQLVVLEGRWDTVVQCVW